MTRSFAVLQAKAKAEAKAKVDTKPKAEPKKAAKPVATKGRGKKDAGELRGLGTCHRVPLAAAVWQHRSCVCAWRLCQPGSLVAISYKLQPPLPCSHAPVLATKATSLTAVSSYLPPSASHDSHVQHQHSA